MLYPATSPLCFRGCNLRGDMLHSWWECPKIRGFWNKMFSLIGKVPSIPVQKSPHIALLNSSVESAHKNMQRLIFFILLGTKLTIAKSWKKPTVSVRLAKRKISWIMVQEKITSVLLNSTEKFEAIWEPWATCMHCPLTPWLHYCCFTLHTVWQNLLVGLSSTLPLFSNLRILFIPLLPIHTVFGYSGDRLLF